MKSRLLLLLLACGSVNAEPLPLPPAVDNATYPAGPPASSRPASATTLYELMGRLEQLQSEVQQLTGKVEEQTYLITDMKKRQSTMYADFDERVQVLEKKLESTASPASAAGEANKTDGNKAVAPAAPATVEKTAEPKPAPAVTGDSKEPYQHAYDALRNGHTSQAITEFKDLLSKNPKGEYAGNAQYWLGEAYRVNQDVDSARKAFSAVVDNYPASAKVPDALLKLGYIEIEQKNPAKARDYLTKVTVGYPNSTAAHLAAKKLLLIDPPKNEPSR
ncbi:MAG: tol-pal system protein YbgF [Methylococcaceae bacterium]|nr:tol-pal system protein YbgF [Methylococcaceae bacterium]MDP3019122.1 tol-pal system protein YbgF [Methylococcaceae bacterium]MDP3390338.1 tol-pal system protein YbgF [Methylococcaceae bacterium]MDP3932968.1 tol-pal system protein YbgF [Methylococcaceae bacterium]MDZ4156393.1 tol-pal system protein YbgF [Methylococcales bacterium]